MRPEELRSHRWWGGGDMRSSTHRQRMHQMGLRKEEFLGRPVIAIVNTWSELSPCHLHLRDRVEDVRRGVLQAGGVPVELPALSLGEIFVKPTTMMYRNLLAIEVEELLRSHPIDGAVLLGGCDKTTPALLMGAISMGIPVIFCPAGPMLSGNWRGEVIGAGTQTRKYWDEYRAGKLTGDDWADLETVSVRSVGTCNTMGTASTMTAIAETLGMTLPGASSVPAVDSAHVRMMSASGSRIVEMVWEDLKPNDILTSESFDNATVVLMALGGSTNACIHLLALAGRIGVSLSLKDFDAEARKTPVLADIYPAGSHLMEDFYHAGGLPALLERLSDRLNLNAMTVNGRSLGENIATACVWNDRVIRSLGDPVSTNGAFAVLYGNLAPRGAILKTSAASPSLLRHSGPAFVFESAEDLTRNIDDPDLPVDRNTVIVLRGVGPVGGPGMPEWGNLPIPKKLLTQGVRDMVRLSDARISGTHYGTCIVHVSPEAHVGGPIALLRTGDIVDLDVESRSIGMRVDDAELAKRKAIWGPPQLRYVRGYGALFQKHITQADRGCDFDFLSGTAATPDPEISTW